MSKPKSRPSDRPSRRSTNNTQNANDDRQTRNMRPGAPSPPNGRAAAGAGGRSRPASTSSQRPAHLRKWPAHLPRVPAHDPALRRVPAWEKADKEQSHPTTKGPAPAEAKGPRHAEPRAESRSKTSSPTQSPSRKRQQQLEDELAATVKEEKAILAELAALLRDLQLPRHSGNPDNDGQQVDALVAKAEKSRTEHSKLRETNRALQTEIARLKNDVATLQRRLATSELENDMLDGEVEALRAPADSPDKQSAALKAFKRKSVDLVARLRAENSQLSESVTELEGKTRLALGEAMLEIQDLKANGRVEGETLKLEIEILKGEMTKVKAKLAVAEGTARLPKVEGSKGKS
ncbi:hypothetical protein BDW74DRAFT_175223 [Aspergillus multicolor]|uniref:uncharacterized protein n=1 Tax=Aspergillus multicolor TaxID=41759 RepID=UPI003CCCCE03